MSIERNFDEVVETFAMKKARKKLKLNYIFVSFFFILVQETMN